MPDTLQVPDWAQDTQVPDWAQDKPFKPLDISLLARQRPAAVASIPKTGRPALLPEGQGTPEERIGGLASEADQVKAGVGREGRMLYGSIEDALQWLADPLAEGDANENLKAAIMDKTMPIEETIGGLAKKHPALAVGANIGKDVTQMAPLMAVGGLPGIVQKAVALGFSAQMIVGVKDLATQYGDEMGKPVDQRDPAKLADLRSRLIQTGVFAPLAGAAGASASRDLMRSKPVGEPDATTPVQTPPTPQKPVLPQAAAPVRPLATVGDAIGSQLDKLRLPAEAVPDWAKTTGGPELDSPPITGKVTAENIDSLTPEQQATLTHGHGIEYGLTLSQKEGGKSGSLQSKYDAAAEEMKQAAQKGDNAAMKAAFGKLNFFGGALMGASRGKHPISGSNYTKFIEQHPELAPKPPGTLAQPPVKPAAPAQEGAKTGQMTKAESDELSALRKKDLSEDGLAKDEEQRMYELSRKETQSKRAAQTSKLAAQLKEQGIEIPDSFLHPSDGVENHIHSWTYDHRNGMIQIRVERHTDASMSGRLITVKAGDVLTDGMDDSKVGTTRYREANPDSALRAGEKPQTPPGANPGTSKLSPAVRQSTPQSLGGKDTTPQPATQVPRFGKVDVKTSGSVSRIRYFDKDGNEVGYGQLDGDVINYVSVEPKYQRQGFGSEIVKDLKQRGGKIGVAGTPEGTALMRSKKVGANEYEPNKFNFKSPSIPAQEGVKPLPELKDNYLKPLKTYTPTLFRETSADEAENYLPNTRTSSPANEHFVANTENLARGQGSNKGVMLEFDSGNLEGQVNTSKPGWKPAYDNGEAEFRVKYVTPAEVGKNLKSITVRSNAKSSRVGNIILKQRLADLESKGWTRSKVEGGTKWTRPEAPTPPPSPSVVKPKAETPAKQTASPNLEPPKPGEMHIAGFGGSSRSIPSPETPEQLKETQQAYTPGLDAGSDVSGVKSLLLPSAKGKEHLQAAEDLGAKLGAMHRRAEVAKEKLEQSWRMFNRLGVENPKLTPDKNPGIKFMSDMSQGRPLAGKLKMVGDLVQRLFDERLTKLEAAGAPIQVTRDKYFPGMWTRESRLAFNAAMEKMKFPEGFDLNTASAEQKASIKAQVDEFLESGEGSEKDMLGYLTRKPMKGKESFRKQKVFDDIMTGAEVGLKPVSANPVDLVKLKLAEMDRSIMANEFFQQQGEKGKLETIDPYQEVPQGWVMINDKYGTIYGGPTVKIPEFVDKRVYDGLLGVAEKIGVKHSRNIGIGGTRLGYSIQGGSQIVTRFATETSVLAHELGHQIDHKYGLWDDLTGGGRGNAKGYPQDELRKVADIMVGSRGAKGYTHKKEEKIAQMIEAYVHAPAEMQKVAPRLFKWFDEFLKARPELKPLSEIAPGIQLKAMTSEKYVGLLIMGYRIVPEATGDIINNYLSSSLYNNKYFGKLYKGWMALANALNQSQLGMGSAFHAGFTTVDVQVSAGANLIKDIYGVARGNRSPADLADTAKTWAVSSVKTAMTGDKVLNAWRNPDGVIDPKIAQVVKAAELAGAGFHMEAGMMTEQTAKVMRDWYSGNHIKAAARSPVALTELLAKPIMQYLVPRQKAGVFAELVNRIIEQNPGKPLEDLTPQFRQAWNRVDARLGQVRYDRLFANNTAKNVVQGLVRAPGWSAGTIAEIGGAFPDAAKFMREWAATGKLPANIPDRVAYTVSLLMTVGAINSALTYAFTGQMPRGMDFFAFRTGRKDDQGNDERFLLPSYVKDMLAYAKRPLTTLEAKEHPLINVLTELAHNHSYYGYEIRDTKANPAVQAYQAGKYVLKSFEPFWISGAAKQYQSKATGAAKVAGVVAPYFGVMPAPKYIEQSPLENKIEKLFDERTGESTKPYEAQFAPKKPHEANTLYDYLFSRLPASDKVTLYKEMSAEEKARYVQPLKSGEMPKWYRDMTQ